MIWPYRILERDDEDVKSDLETIMQHFASDGKRFDTVVFVPNAGMYLGGLFHQVYDGAFEVQFMTVRRASTVARSNKIKECVFRSRHLSNAMRHMDVMWRLILHALGKRQKMVGDTDVRFDVRGKDVLVIDDDIATGTTLAIIKAALLKRGASSVMLASISNHFLPREVHVDYSVYEYALLRTKNSRDYHAG